jgi:protein-tyrosine phosphatase
MAQGLLAHALPELNVGSAGLGAMIGMPADESAVVLLREKGIDISAHRAVQLNRQMCIGADLVLVMDGEQRARVSSLYPQVHGKTFRLGEYTKQDIPDPYRAPRSEFLRVLDLIEAGLAEWLHRIKKL